MVPSSPLEPSRPKPEAGDGDQPALTPVCLLVVGMDAPELSATAGALSDMGLAPPGTGEDRSGGPHGRGQEGGEREPGRTRSLSALNDRLLERLGRSLDDPPPPPVAPCGVPPELETMLDEGRELFEQVFPATAGPSAAIWDDPRTTLLLGYWRAALDRPLAAVLVTSSPLDAAARGAFEGDLDPLSALALWERYARHGLTGLGGLPALVTSFREASSDPPGWFERAGRWLASCGVEVRPPSRLLVAPPEPGGPAVPPTVASREPLLLAPQRKLHDVLSRLQGSHARLEAPELDPESAWSAAHLEQRHDLRRLWAGFEWAANQVALLPAGGARPTPEPASEYPKDATDDEARYHAWLRSKGEATHVGSGEGLARPRTRPPEELARPLFSVVVPTYRPPSWAIDRCVSSVLEQDFASFELRIVDDASGDRAARARLEKIAAVDSRITVRFRSENGGISAATNDGIEGARGEWVVFLDHDDELAAGALRRLAAAIEAAPDAGLVYSDEDKIDEAGRRFMPAFKPSWSPDLLLSNAYMCHVLVVRRRLVDELGGLRSEFDGAQDYDLMLRATERLEARQIVHLPAICYHWRTIVGSASGDPNAKPWAFEAGRRAVADAVRRRGIDATVTMHPRIPGSYHVRRRVTGRPIVSAIVPFRDEPALLASCYRAFVADPGHEDFELLLVDNDSALPETRAVMDELTRDPRVRVVAAPGPFDWVRINNEAVAKARGELLLFMNNDVEACSSGWLGHMAAQAQRDDVGAVGARLLFPDGTIQHGGVAVGVCWGAAHLQQGIDGYRPGYLSGMHVVRNTSAVTGACMMTRRDLFESLGGFDTSLPVAFNDIDYCLRTRERDLLVIYTPLAELVHHESKSRGHTDDVKERPYFRSRWREVMLAGDPYYNPNLGRFDSYCRLPNEEDDERWETFRSMLNGSSTS